MHYLSNIYNYFSRANTSSPQTPNSSSATPSPTLLNQTNLIRSSSPALFIDTDSYDKSLVKKPIVKKPPPPLPHLEERIEQVFYSMLVTTNGEIAARELLKAGWIHKNFLVENRKKEIKEVKFFIHNALLVRSSQVCTKPALKIGKDGNLKAYIHSSPKTDHHKITKAFQYCKLDLFYEASNAKLAPKVYRSVKNMGLTYLPETPKEEAAPCGISYDYSFISKYANQGDMICFLTNNSSMPLSLRLDLAEKLIKNLSILHSSHIAHRDLKPDNVLIHKEMEWQVWICDFGFATRKAYSSKKCGSRLYVPPEYDQNYFIDINHNFDCKNAETIQKFYNTFLTDIYTLGLTLFSLMSNQAYEEALIEYKENYAQETNELFIKCQHLEDFINYKQLLSNKMIEEYLQDYHSKHVEALKGMIKYYPHERMSLEQILQLWSD